MDAEYATALKRIDDSLDAAMLGLFADQSMTDAEIAAARAALADAARQLDDLEPPADVRVHHRQYRDGVANFRPIIDELSAARGNPARVREHLADPQYAEVVKDLETSKQGFDDAGYEL